MTGIKKTFGISNLKTEKLRMKDDKGKGYIRAVLKIPNNEINQKGS